MDTLFRSTMPFVFILAINDYKCHYITIILRLLRRFITKVVVPLYVTGGRYYVLHRIIGILTAYIKMYSHSVTKNLPVLEQVRSLAGGLWRPLLRPEWEHSQQTWSWHVSQPAAWYCNCMTQTQIVNDSECQHFPSVGAWQLSPGHEP